MVYRPMINCIHRDNWNRCKVHVAPWWLRWLLPKGRPACVFSMPYTPQDGKVECAEQEEYHGHYPRSPAPPPPPPDRFVKEETPFRFPPPPPVE